MSYALSTEPEYVYQGTCTEAPMQVIMKGWVAEGWIGSVDTALFPPLTCTVDLYLLLKCREIYSCVHTLVEQPLCSLKWHIDLPLKRHLNKFMQRNSAYVHCCPFWASIEHGDAQEHGQWMHQLWGHGWPAHPRSPLHHSVNEEGCLVKRHFNYPDPMLQLQE